MNAEDQDIPRNPCPACGKMTGRRAFSLSRLVSTVTLQFHTIMGPLEWGWVSDVRDAEGLLDFCNNACWKKAEPEVREAWRLQATFPSGPPIVPCSRCAGAVDRRQLHTVLALSDETFLPDDSVETHDAWDYAILCKSCGDERNAEQREEESEATADHVTPQGAPW